MKNILDKIKAAEGTINPKFDMGIYSMRDIIENSKDNNDIAYYGFRYGYMQGVKAAKHESKVKTIENPKYRNEYRNVISDNLKKIKNTMDLERLYKLTNLCISVGSDSNEDFAEEDIVLYLILNGLTREKHSLKVLRNIHTFVNSYTRAAEGRMQG